MRRVLLFALCAALALAAVTPAAADPDPDKTPGGLTTLDCPGVGSFEVVILNGGIHLTESTAMFVPRKVWLDGQLVFHAPGSDKDAVNDITCTWVGPATGRVFTGAGILTPARGK